MSCVVWFVCDVCVFVRVCDVVLRMLCNAIVSFFACGLHMSCIVLRVLCEDLYDALCVVLCVFACDVCVIVCMCVVLC